MKFRYKRGIPVPYARQGYIYFKSLRFSGLPVREQERIRRLCCYALIASTKQIITKNKEVVKP